MQTFGKSLRRARLNQKLKGADLATALAISPAYVSMVEGGNRTPSSELAGRWIAAVSTAGPERQKLMKRWLEQAAPGVYQNAFLASMVEQAIADACDPNAAAMLLGGALVQLVRNAGLGKDDILQLLDAFREAPDLARAFARLAQLPAAGRAKVVEALELLIDVGATGKPLK